MADPWLKSKCAVDIAVPTRLSSTILTGNYRIMTVIYKLDAHDLRAFQRYCQKHHPTARRSRNILLAVMAALCLWMTLTSDDHRIGFRITYFCVLLAVFWALMRSATFIVMRISHWRAYTSDKYRSVLCEHTMTLTDDALIEATPVNESRNLWAGIYQVVDAADYI